MPRDSEPINTGNKPDDFASIIFDIASNVQYKFLGLMLIVFVMISSDVFINRALARFNGAVEYKCPTSWGTILQGMFLVMCMIGVDVFVQQGII